MMHDETCVRISVVQDLNKLIRKQMKAIELVMGLHHKHVGGAEKSIYCYNCQQKYPCTTIQAIEKELS